MILNGKDCCLIGVVIPVNWDSCRWVNGTQIEILYLAFMMFQCWWCFVFPQAASPATGSANQNYFCASILVLSNLAWSNNHSLWAGNTRELLWSLVILNSWIYLHFARILERSHSTPCLTKEKLFNKSSDVMEMPQRYLKTVGHKFHCRTACPN